VRRIDGRSLGTSWREEVAEPWTLDFHIGLSDREQARVLDLIGAIPVHEGDDLDGELYRQATAALDGGDARADPDEALTATRQPPKP
jgi:hypothetical protein